jgi:magnesium transporter
VPGTLVADPQAPHPAIHVLAYGPDDFAEQDIKNLGQLQDLIGRWPVIWVCVEGLGDAGTVAGIGALFGLHPLALEDVVNTHQRAKVDDYGDHLFLAARMVGLAERLETEQIGIFVGKNFVVSFEERPPSSSFDPIRQRIRANHGRVRQAGADYLAYCLLDAIVDGYFPVLDEYAERLESLDEQVVNGNTRATMARIHDMRVDLLMLRRAVWPHREMINTLIRDPHQLLAPETRLHLRDCLDHLVAIVELTETYREMGSDLREYSLSMVSTRLNEIMKVLTMIATTFMPLSFIAGLYGMNFNTQRPGNMPELNWPFGYLFALGMMALVAGSMLLHFWRRGWLGSSLVGPSVEHKTLVGTGSPSKNASQIMPSQAADQNS